MEKRFFKDSANKLTNVTLTALVQATLCCSSLGIYF